LNTQTNESAELSFGRRLRLERERRRITLDSIAANTKIAIALLKGLERDDVSRWPSGIFRRSFIREYANSIGLNPEEVIREFLERFPDPDESTKVPPAKAPEPPVLRLTLADTGKWSLEGSPVSESWRRLAAFACDLAACLALAALLFLALGLFWKPLAIVTLVYYGASILLLGNAPGVFLFGQRPARDDVGDHAAMPALLRMAASRVRRQLRFGRLAALHLRWRKRSLKARERPRPTSTLPFTKNLTVSSHVEGRTRGFDNASASSASSTRKSRRATH
jgi:transcriptional regulator with XRE-family HTH domain